MVPSGSGQDLLELGTDHSDRNPIRKFGEILYCLAAALFPKFQSESNQFHSVSAGHRQDLITYVSLNFI